MKTILHLFEEVINEAKNVTPAIMSDWVNKHRIIKCRYRGADDDPIGTGIRYIEPHALGISPKGFVAIRAYQYSGSTTTRIPEWKIFRVDRFLYWEDTGKTFNTARPNFNEKGDKTFKKVYKIAKFNNQNELNNGEENIPTPTTSI